MSIWQNDNCTTQQRASLTQHVGNNVGDFVQKILSRNIQLSLNHLILFHILKLALHNSIHTPFGILALIFRDVNLFHLFSGENLQQFQDFFVEFLRSNFPPRYCKVILRKAWAAVSFEWETIGSMVGWYTNRSMNGRWLS